MLTTYVVVIVSLCSVCLIFIFFFFSSRRRHTRCALVAGVQTCALPIFDRGGVRAVGYDIQFIEHSRADPIGDMTLDAMAEGGKGRFVFGSASVPDDFASAGNTIPASNAPNAFALVPGPTKPGPGVVLLLPYGEAMQAHKLGRAHV